MKEILLKNLYDPLVHVWDLSKACTKKWIIIDINAIIIYFYKSFRKPSWGIVMNH